MAEHQREPVLLIDYSKNQEAHLVVSPYDTFEELIIQARKIYSSHFKGEWNLSYLNKETKKPEKLDKDTPLLELFKQDINTFYWHYGKRIFKGGGSKSKGRTQRKTTTRSKPHSWGSGKTTYRRGGKAGAVKWKKKAPVEGMQYADVGKRFVAMLIDLFIISLLMRLFGTSWMWFMGWLYFAILESSDMQATFGKMIMKLKVATSKGGKMNFGQATGRYFGKWLSTLMMMFGFVMAFFTDKRQALHDYMADTVVLEDEDD